jgi:predicted AAA+ superfamily ATPase
MRRKIDVYLDDWANTGNSRPLLIRGARRVGKTYSIERLGIERFGNELFALCDFQTNLDQLAQIFSGTIDVERIVAELSLFLRKDIIKGKTLLVFDEIQLSEKALNSLRFFAQSGYRVIATGSQLGITLRDRSLPFPSEVDQVTMHPMDFEEFLWASDEGQIANGIRASFTERRSFLLHEEALALYRQYTVVGGMPAVVQSFIDNHDYDRVRALQAEIDQTCIADIAIYAPSEAAHRTMAIWASIPSQLARETTNKFKYSDVAKGARERTYRSPLAWLEAADLVTLNYQTNEAAAPLAARSGGSFFKAYMADTGIMYYKLNLSAEAYLDESLRTALSSRFRGALAENYVMQALKANGLATFYWTPGTTSQNEVEFVVLNRHGAIIPIEVKSGDNVRSTSLINYRDKTAAPYAIRISARNFGFENGILSVPLYAAFCIDERALIS